MIGTRRFAVSALAEGEDGRGGQNDSTEPAGSVIGTRMLVVESWVCRRATPARPAAQLNRLADQGKK